MNSLASFIAFRYLFFNQKDHTISFMIRMCFIGIFVGSLALMLSLIITRGFEKAIHEKMQGINADIIISVPGSKLDDANLIPFIKNVTGTALAGITSYSINQVIVERGEQTSVLFLKALDPENEHAVTHLPKKIIIPPISPNQFANLLKKGHIILGSKAAIDYNVGTDDTLTILIPDGGTRKKVYLTEKKLLIAGIFSIGLEEYDSNLAFCSHETHKKLFPDSRGVDLIALKLNPNATALSVIKKLKKELPDLTINSWQDLYPALVASLKMEKLVMFLILALITLVASLSMVSLLFMIIQYKRRDLALFTTIGMEQKTMRAIFLYIGAFITTLATGCGLLTAAAIGYYLEHATRIELPDVYYVNYLPARLEPLLFVIVGGTVLALGFLATWLPTRNLKNINIIEILRSGQ